MKKVFKNTHALCSVCGDDANHKIGDKYYCGTDSQRVKEEKNNIRQDTKVKKFKKVFKPL